MEIINKNIYRFSKEEIKEINQSHIVGADKWFRMYYGLSSDLVDYKDDIMHIEVKNTESRLKSDRELPVQIIGSWSNILKDKLQNAKGFVVYLYNTKRSPGFALIGSDIGNKELEESLTDKMKVEEDLTLAGIFSGIIGK